jgi:hypothetical protein
MELEAGQQGIGILEFSHWSYARTQHASGHSDLPALGIDGGVKIPLTEHHEASFRPVGEEWPFIGVQRLVQHFQQGAFRDVACLDELAAQNHGTPCICLRVGP